MRPVAGAEPPAVVARAGQRHAAEVRADADEHEPLGVDDARLVRLRVAQRVQRDGARGLDVLLGAPAHEHGLAAPLDRDGLAGGDLGEVDLERGHGQDVGRRRHREDKLEDGEAEGRGVDEAAAREDEVGEGALGVVPRGELLVGVGVVAVFCFFVVVVVVVVGVVGDESRARF